MLTPDSIVPNPANPQSFNRYSYVNNNPINYSDPSGHRPDSGCDIEGCLGNYDLLINYFDQTANPYNITDDPVGYANMVSYFFHSTWDNLSPTEQLEYGYENAIIDAVSATLAQMDSIDGTPSEVYAKWSSSRVMYDAIMFGTLATGAEAIRGDQTSSILLYDSENTYPANPSISNNGQTAPPIKPGSSGGPTAGRRFPESVRQQAFNENPGSVCVFCRMPGVATQVDHAIPRVHGGNATIDNAQLACPHCNASKGARMYPVNPPPGYEGSWPPLWWP